MPKVTSRRGASRHVADDYHYRPDTDRSNPYRRPTLPRSPEYAHSAMNDVFSGSFKQRSGSDKEYSRAPPRSDQEDVRDYLYDLRRRTEDFAAPLPSRVQRQLHPKVHERLVRYDRYEKHANHMNEDVARQFNMNVPHVLDIMRYMLDVYDTVTVYSSRLIEEGALIYFADSFIVGPNRSVMGSFRVHDGYNSEVKVKVKGRFGIVVRKYGQHLKIAPVYTFNGRGLSSKHRSLWKEYVQLADPRDFESSEEDSEEESEEDSEEEGEIREEDPDMAPPNKPLQVEKAACEIKDTSVAHLLTTTISSSAQIMLAGYITSKALLRLRRMIAKMEA